MKTCVDYRTLYNIYISRCILYVFIIFMYTHFMHFWLESVLR